MSISWWKCYDQRLARTYSCICPGAMVQYSLVESWREFLEHNCHQYWELTVFIFWYFDLWKRVSRKNNLSLYPSHLFSSFDMPSQKIHFYKSYQQWRKGTEIYIACSLRADYMGINTENAAGDGACVPPQGQ